MVKNPGRYTVRQSSTSATPARDDPHHRRPGAHDEPSTSMTRTLRIARDYNRALPAPIRWIHLAAAATAALWRWAGAPRRRTWARPLLLALAGVALLVPFDLAIVHLSQRLHLGGDVRRELELVQQFGAPASICIAALTIWLLDPTRRRRLLDWAVCIGASFVVVNTLKMLLGRPRPKFDAPFTFLGPFRSFNMDGSRLHSWQFWRDGASDLWAMPSSHTAAAVGMAVVLTRWYPPLRPLMLALAGIVAVCRVFFDAHYPSDVVAGAAVGYAVTAGVLNAIEARRKDGPCKVEVGPPTQSPRTD